MLKSKVKTMMHCFSDIRENIHEEFLPLKYGKVTAVCNGNINK
jgi:hypothetical protein